MKQFTIALSFHVEVLFVCPCALVVRAAQLLLRQSTTCLCRREVASGSCLCAKLPLLEILPGRSIQMRWAGTCQPLTDIGGYVYSGDEPVNAVSPKAEQPQCRISFNSTLGQIIQQPCPGPCPRGCGDCNIQLPRLALPIKK